MTTDSPTVDTAAEGTAPEPVEGAGTTTQDSTSVPESSTGEGSNKSLLDIVTTAAGYHGKEDGADSDGASPTPQAVEGAVAEDAAPAKAEDAEDEDRDDFTAEEKAALNPKTRRRIDRLRGKLKEVSTEVEALRTPAQEFGKVQDFMRQNGLSAERVASALHITALVAAAEEGRGDPARALAEVNRIRDGLMRVTGEVLPADLQKKVDDGFLDEQSAREVAKARIDREHAKTVRTQAEQSTRTVQAQQVQGHIRSEAVAWEQQIRARDPDYGHKAAHVEVHARALMQQYGPPRNPKEARELLDSAYARANEAVKALVPRPASTPRRPGSDAAVTGPTKPVPRTLEEAVTMAATGRTSA